MDNTCMTKGLVEAKITLTHKQLLDILERKDQYLDLKKDGEFRWQVNLLEDFLAEFHESSREDGESAAEWAIRLIQENEMDSLRL